MSIERHIFAGNDIREPQLLNLSPSWETAVVFDPNKEHHPESEDVLGAMAVNNAVLLVIIDGISTSTKANRGNYGFNSGPVAQHFVEAAFVYAAERLGAPVKVPFSLTAMHQNAANSIQTAHAKNALSKGGVVGVSLLLCPDGSSRIQRFGDAQAAIPQAGRLDVPDELLPENQGLQEYLAAKVRGNLASDLLANLRTKNVLNATRGNATVLRYAGTQNGLPEKEGERDIQMQLQKGQFILAGSDGLEIYRGLADHAQPQPEDTAHSLLERIYRNALWSSTDNITGVAVQFKG